MATCLGAVSRCSAPAPGQPFTPAAAPVLAPSQACDPSKSEACPSAAAQATALAVPLTGGEGQSLAGISPNPQMGWDVTIANYTAGDITVSYVLTGQTTPYSTSLSSGSTYNSGEAAHFPVGVGPLVLSYDGATYTLEAGVPTMRVQGTVVMGQVMVRNLNNTTNAVVGIYETTRDAFFYAQSLKAAYTATLFSTDFPAPLRPPPPSQQGAGWYVTVYNFSGGDDVHWCIGPFEGRNMPNETTANAYFATTTACNGSTVPCMSAALLPSATTPCPTPTSVPGGTQLLSIPFSSTPTALAPVSNIALATEGDSAFLVVYPEGSDYGTRYAALVQALSQLIPPQPTPPTIAQEFSITAANLTHLAPLSISATDGGGGTLQVSTTGFTAATSATIVSESSNVWNLVITLSETTMHLLAPLCNGNTLVQCVPGAPPGTLVYAAFNYANIVVAVFPGGANGPVTGVCTGGMPFCTFLSTAAATPAGTAVRPPTIPAHAVVPMEVYPLALAPGSPPPSFTLSLNSYTIPVRCGTASRPAAGLTLLDGYPLTASCSIPGNSDTTLLTTTYESTSTQPPLLSSDSSMVLQVTPTAVRVFLFVGANTISPAQGFFTALGKNADALPAVLSMTGYNATGAADITMSILSQPSVAIASNASSPPFASLVWDGVPLPLEICGSGSAPSCASTDLVPRGIAGVVLDGVTGTHAACTCPCLSPTPLVSTAAAVSSTALPNGVLVTAPLPPWSAAIGTDATRALTCTGYAALFPPGTAATNYAAAWMSGSRAPPPAYSPAPSSPLLYRVFNDTLSSLSFTLQATTVSGSTTVPDTAVPVRSAPAGHTLHLATGTCLAWTVRGTDLVTSFTASYADIFLAATDPATGRLVIVIWPGHAVYAAAFYDAQQATNYVAAVTAAWQTKAAAPPSPPLLAPPSITLTAYNPTETAYDVVFPGATTVVEVAAGSRVVAPSPYLVASGSITFILTTKEHTTTSIALNYDATGVSEVQKIPTGPDGGVIVLASTPTAAAVAYFASPTVAEQWELAIQTAPSTAPLPSPLCYGASRIPPWIWAAAAGGVLVLIACIGLGVAARQSHRKNRLR